MNIYLYLPIVPCCLEIRISIPGFLTTLLTAYSSVEFGSKEYAKFSTMLFTNSWDSSKGIINFLETIDASFSREAVLLFNPIVFAVTLLINVIACRNSPYPLYCLYRR